MLPPLNEKVFDLNIEQQLILEQARRGVQDASREELQSKVLALFELYLAQQSLIRHLSKNGG